MRISDWSSDVCSADLPAAAKAAFAILQIIAPEPHETFVESRGQFACLDDRVEPLAPLAQRFGIVAAEAAHVAPGESALLGERAKAAFREQAAAGEDIGLDEIAARRIGIEQRVVDQ